MPTAWPARPISSRSAVKISSRGPNERKLDELTLTEAAEYSGLSYSTIQRKIASGKLRNVGEKNRPRIYRGDLPKRSEPVPTTETGEPDLAEMILRSRMSRG